jgi:Ca-activated chloride channel family protein
VTLADHFARPEAAPLLLAIPLMWLLLRALERRRTRRNEASLGPRLAALAPELDPAAPRARRWLLCGGLLFALLALLEPLVGAAGTTLTPKGADVVLVLDVSRSMLARDSSPTRLRAAQREIEALTKEAAGDRLALVLFAGAARRLVPLTRDLESLRALLEGVGPESVAQGGSDVEAGLDTALAALAAGASGEPGGRRDDAAIVLLGDGEELQGSGLAAAQRCRARGVVVHALGFGSREGSKIALAAEPGREAFLRDRAGRDVVSALDAAALARLAEATGGTYADAASSRNALVDLVRGKIEPHARAALAAADRSERADRFQWPLAVALLLFALASRWSDARTR